MSCEGFDPNRCASEPWHECCTPCPPPGGGGLCQFLPAYADQPFPSQHGLFYSWETPTEHTFRVLRVNTGGTVDIRIEYANGQGECYKPQMPYSTSDRQVRIYQEDRRVWLGIRRKHLNEFGEAWKAHWGLRLPLGGYYDGTYYLPRTEGHDCPALILKRHADGGLVDLRLTYASGNGWSNVRMARVLSRRKLQEHLDIRRVYCEMIEPYQELAVAEWKQYSGEKY